MGEKLSSYVDSLDDEQLDRLTPDELTKIKSIVDSGDDEDNAPPEILETLYGLHKRKESLAALKENEEYGAGLKATQFEPSVMGSFTRAVGEGATAGLGKFATAAALPGPQIKNVQEKKRELEFDAKENPIATGLGEFVGGMITPLNLVPGGPAVGGALYGGIRGAADSVETGQKIGPNADSDFERAAKGAALGGTFGGALGYALPRGLEAAKGLIPGATKIAKNAVPQSAREYIAKKSNQVFAGAAALNPFKREGVSFDEYLHAVNSPDFREKASSFNAQEAGDRLAAQATVAQKGFKTVGDYYGRKNAEAAKNISPQKLQSGIDEMNQKIDFRTQYVQNRPEFGKQTRRDIQETLNLMETGQGPSEAFEVASGTAFEKLKPDEKFLRMWNARKYLGDRTKWGSQQGNPKMSSQMETAAKQDIYGAIGTALKQSPEQVAIDALYSKAKSIDTNLFKPVTFKQPDGKYVIDPDKLISAVTSDRANAHRFVRNLDSFDSFVKENRGAFENSDVLLKFVDNVRKEMDVSEVGRTMSRISYQSGPTSPAVQEMGVLSGGLLTLLTLPARAPGIYMNTLDKLMKVRANTGKWADKDLVFAHKKLRDWWNTHQNATNTAFLAAAARAGIPSDLLPIFKTGDSIPATSPTEGPIQ